MTIKLQHKKQLKCQYCDEDTKVWNPIEGGICRFSSENGFCKKDGKICPQCKKLVGRLRLMYFIGGPGVCDECKDKELDDML